MVHMRSVTLLGVYVVGVFVVGGLVAPWLAVGVAALAQFWPVLAGLAEHPFSRFVHRSLLLVAILGLWPLLKVAGMGSWGAVGWKASAGGYRRFGVGLLTVMMLMAGAGLLMLLVGARSWNAGVTERIPAVLARAGSSGLVVGLLEEILFRGVLFGLLLRSLRLGPALVWSSVIYAALHFLGRPADPEEMRWWSGWGTVGGMISGLFMDARIIPAGLTLTMLGMLLGVCYWRTGDLFLSVGIHAGLVFSLKVLGSVTSPVAASHLWFWGSKRWIDGWLALVLVAVLWWICDRLTRRGEGVAAAGGDGVWREVPTEVGDL
jgi:uncharacterized protein